MILQALFQYYQRSLDEPDSMIAPRGMQHQEIPNVIVLSPEGEFVNLLILRGENGSARKFYVPRERVRSGTKSYEFPNALWDHVGFVSAILKMIQKMPRNNMPPLKNYLRTSLRDRLMFQLQ